MGPVRAIRHIVQDSGDPGYVNRLLIGTATTGLVRIEWVAARYGAIIPCNWSNVTMTHYMDAYIPLRYQVADAQNLIVREAIQKDFEWLLLLEHDVCIPPDAFVILNEYMSKPQVPVVSGLYYSRSMPSEPLIYRGRGNGAFWDWKLGDRVLCDGVPTGMLLIHCSILRAMWAESPEYAAGNQVTRRVFDTPRRVWVSPDDGRFNATSGTSDLDWCDRVIKERWLERAGWPQYQALKYPFVVDTRLFCTHIDPDGRRYP